MSDLKIEKLVRVSGKVFELRQAKGPVCDTCDLFDVCVSTERYTTLCDELNIEGKEHFKEVRNQNK